VVEKTPHERSAKAKQAQRNTKISCIPEILLNPFPFMLTPNWRDGIMTLRIGGPFSELRKSAKRVSVTIPAQRDDFNTLKEEQGRAPGRDASKGNLLRTK
jgi:hypothetical protein